MWAGTRNRIWRGRARKRDEDPSSSWPSDVLAIRSSTTNLRGFGQRFPVDCNSPSIHPAKHPSAHSTPGFLLHRFFFSPSAFLLVIFILRLDGYRSSRRSSSGGSILNQAMVVFCRRETINFFSFAFCWRWDGGSKKKRIQLLSPEIVSVMD